MGLERQLENDAAEASIRKQQVPLKKKRKCKVYFQFNVFTSSINFFLGGNKRWLEINPHLKINESVRVFQLALTRSNLSNLGDLPQVVHTML